MDQLDELVGFVKSNERLDVKTLALHHMLSMTGHFESRKMIVDHKEALDVLTELAFDEEQQKAINKDAFFCLINLAADELDATKIIDRKSTKLVSRLLNYVIDEKSRFADTACAILSNLSRGRSNSERIFNEYFNPEKSAQKKDEPSNLERVLKVFCTEGFNKTNKLDYLAPFICNLTQLETVQEMILSDSLILQRLLPYTTYQRSIIRRGGIIGAIKNCCFKYGTISLKKRNLYTRLIHF